MGFFGGKKKEVAQKKEEEAAPPPQPSKPALESPAVAQPKPDANAALLAETSVFEFGSAANNDDSKTLAGYCPVSDGMEPCRWELLPAGGNEAPQFRIIF